MPSYEIAELIINVTGQMDSLLTIGFNSTASMNGIPRAAWCTGRITTPMTDNKRFAKKQKSQLSII